MADTNPAASGLSTSEGKLTAIAMVVGALLEGVAGVLHTLQDAGHAAPWFPAVFAVVGVLLQLASLLGYQKSRTLLKAAAIASDSAPTQNPK